MSSARFCKRLLPVFLLAAAGLSSCLEEEMQGRVVPIGDKESYTVSDTAILYVMTGDTARVQVQFNLDADTVTGADLQLIFEQATQAEDFFAAYSTDSEIDHISFDGPFISYSTSNYNGLHRADVIRILKGKYVVSDAAVTLTNEEHDFSSRTLDELADGMYVLFARTVDEKSSLVWRGSSASPQTVTASVLDERCPWRLFRAPAQPLLRGASPDRWCIQLSNGRYLRRSGNRLAPLALTTCAQLQQATAWDARQVIDHFNLWTLHTDIAGSDDFYGLVCGKSNALDVAVSALDTYSFLAAPVTLRFCAKDEQIASLDAFWGVYLALPDADDVHLSADVNDGAFIGWNTVEGQIDGYLAPGTLVEADNTTYYAVFVKTDSPV